MVDSYNENEFSDTPTYNYCIPISDEKKTDNDGNYISKIDETNVFGDYVISDVELSKIYPPPANLEDEINSIKSRARIIKNPECLYEENEAAKRARYTLGIILSVIFGIIILFIVKRKIDSSGDGITMLSLGVASVIGFFLSSILLSTIKFKCKSNKDIYD
jgi:hypothetical protein